MIEKIEDKIIRVLEGSQDYHDLKIFFEWYNASEENRSSFLLLKDTYDRRKGGIYPSEFEIHATWERISKTVINRSSRKSRHTIGVIMGSAAALAIILIVLGISFFPRNEEIKWEEIRTLPRSAPQSIYLSDGSTIILNASSYLKYPEKFTSDKREVYLDGEAYFNIANDKRKEFVVYTDNQAVRVLGTEFNILGYSQDPITVTTLVEGKIKLETLDNANRVMHGITMYPNQQLYFDRQNNQASVAYIDFKNTVEWIDGVYSFRDASLENITKRIGNVTGITFIIPDEMIRQEAYTGKFFYDQTPEDITKVLNFKGQYSFKTDNDTIYILNNLNKQNLPM